MLALLCRALVDALVLLSLVFSSLPRSPRGITPAAGMSEAETPEALEASEAASSDTTPTLVDELIELDPRGNVILAIQKDDGTLVHRVRCCSRILELSSEVFSVMFASTLREGAKLREQDCPTLDFKEEYPDAMLDVLRILHHRWYEVVPSLDRVASIAIEADKFNCSLALHHWALLECTKFIATYNDSFTSVDQVGNLMVAACQFQLSNPYPYLWIAMRNLPLSSFKTIHKHKTLKHVPDVISHWLCNQIAEIVSLVQAEVYSVEGRLRDNQHSADVSDPDKQLFCKRCKEVYPKTQAACRNCRHVDLITHTCRSGSRVAQYFEVLKKHDLWPSTVAFRSKSLWSIRESVRLLKSDHTLCGGKKCPLVEQLELLPAALVAITKKYVPQRGAVREDLPSVPSPW